MDMSNFAYAIWPWGTQKKEQMEQAAKEITEVGFSHFESVKAAIYAYDMNLDAYREVLKKYNLTPVSFYFHLPQKESIPEFFSTLEKELDFVSKLDVKTLSLQASMGRPDENNYEAEMEYEFDNIMRFAAVADKFGITTCLHPHNNTRVMIEKEIDYVFERVSEKELAFVPDTAHLLAGKCDPLAVIKKYVNRVKFTHLKDFTQGTDVGSVGVASAGMEVYKNFVELGTGSVDFKSVFKILDDAGYNGYHCIELDSVPNTHAESAKNNYNYILNL